MDKNKISQEFLKSAFLLGKEITNKDDLTEKEQDFLKHLDKIVMLIES